MSWIFIVFAVVCVLFSFVVFFGAPYVPTLRPQIHTAFELLDLKPGQTMLELGSGDGRVLKAAAERGLNVVGYELNPLLAIFSYFYTWRYRKQVKIVWGNFWRKQWPPADGMFVFLLVRYMPKLETKIMTAPHRPSKLASFAAALPGKKPVKTKNGVFLYKY